MLLATLIVLITKYGYFIVFLFTLLEGETVVALAGFVAYQGYLKIGYVIAIAIIGGVIGDQSFFYFGRYKGKQFLARRPKLLRRAERLHGLVERHQNWLIFGSRFMYGFRTIIPIVIGTSNVKPSRFFLLNVAGAIVWGIFFAVGGYAFGGALERFIGHFHRAERYVIFGMILGALIVQGIVILRRQLGEKLNDESEETSPRGDHESIK